MGQQKMPQGKQYNKFTTLGLQLKITGQALLDCPAFPIRPTTENCQLPTGDCQLPPQAFIYLKNSLLSFVSTIFSRMNSMHSIGFLSARYLRKSQVLDSSS